MTVRSLCDHEEVCYLPLTLKSAVSQLFPEIVRCMNIQVLEIKKSEKIFQRDQSWMPKSIPSGISLPRQLWTR